MDQMVFYGVLGSAGFLVLSVLASVFYTLKYKSKVTDKRPPLPSVESGTLDANLIIMSDGRFKYGLCDNWCWADCDMCINTTCCLATRIADTHSTAGTGKSFWFLFWVFEVIFILEQIINAVEGFAEDPITGAPMDFNPGWIVSGILHCLIMVNLRQVLRQKFGGPKSNCCFDCAIWFCCPLCAACQESKQVDEAQGSKVKCCCNLQIVGDPMAAKPVPVQAQPVIVGQAVKAEPVVQAQPVMEGQVVEANVQS
jgi:Cys-rich protein (TIGR01571 family)